MSEPVTPALLITPLKAALLQGMAQTVTALVRVRAPNASEVVAAARTTTNVALVIDRSGSMDGAALQEAVRCAGRLQLTLAAPEGVRLQVLNDLPSAVRDGFLVVALPDLAYGAEAWVVVELQVSAALAAGTPLSLLKVAASATTPDGLPLAFHDTALHLPALPPAAFEVVLADPLVAARKAELDASDLLQQARDAAAHGH